LKNKAGADEENAMKGIIYCRCGSADALGAAGKIALSF
jgi:hypothetical protein